MSDGIDQVSKSLGKLEANMEASQRQRAEIFTQLGHLSMATTELTAAMVPLTTMVEAHDKQIHKLNALKNKAIGWVGAVGLSAGGLGTYLSNMLNLK